MGKRIQNKFMKYIFITLLFFIVQNSLAQYQDGLSIKKSPAKKVESTFGFAKVEIVYGSPKQKGRTLFGDLVPYGEVWRLGADAATTITISTDFRLADNDIKAGKYALFLKPQENGDWDFILNYQSEQWGAYDYDDSLDVLVFKVKPVDVQYRRENLIIDFEEYAQGEGELSIHWGTKLITIPFTVDLLSQFMITAQNKINNTPETERWASYLQAAEYLANQGNNTQQAMEWIKKAQKEYKKYGKDWASKANDYYEGHILWTQAKIYAAMGKHKKSLKIAKTVAANKSEKSFYTYENDPERENIDGLMSVWKD